MAQQADHPRVMVLADLHHMTVEAEPIVEHLAQAAELIRHLRDPIPDLEVFGLVEMFVFIGMLLLGYIYVWRRGAFDWNR